jgi:hypothetical protein
MVAKIKRVSHLASTLNYNEQKVKQGWAFILLVVIYRIGRKWERGSLNRHAWDGGI